jgi:methylmalonyl-CoA mutase N-terminal domain/subunit
VVGVNRYVEEELEVEDTLTVDPAIERAQIERLKAFKADRDQAPVEQRLNELRDTARGTDNLLPHIRAALADRASIGEVCGAMRDVFGEYQPEL